MPSWTKQGELGPSPRIPPAQPRQERMGGAGKALYSWDGKNGFFWLFGFPFPLGALVSASGSQVSSHPQSHGHTQSPRTAAHCHHHRSQSCGTGIHGIRGTHGGSGSSPPTPQSWGHSCPRSLEHSWRRLRASTVLGSLGGTWAMGGTWKEAGTAAGSAGRTLRQEVDLEQIKETFFYVNTEASDKSPFPLGFVKHLSP